MRSSIPAFVDSAGLANFRLVALAPTGIEVDSFSAYYRPRQEYGTLPAGAGLSLHVVRLPHSQVTSVISPLDNPGSCTTTAVGSYKFNGVVGATLVNRGSVSAQLTYVNGSSSTLGSGVSASGAAGTFSASGSSTVSHTAETDYPAYAHSQSIFWLTTFGYTKDKVVCTPLHGPTITDYEANAAQQLGGATSQNTSYPKLTYCLYYQAGTGLTATSGSAHDFAVGVQAGSTLGVSLSAQTGYSKSASLNYHSGSVPFHLCGESNYPATAHPGYIGATN